MVAEQGKTIGEARAEIEYSVLFLEWFAEEAKRIYGDIVPSVKLGQKLFTFKQPIGVVGAITPWNFPVAMIIRKMASILAAGCVMVLKPSEETPLSALAIEEIAEKEFERITSQGGEISGTKEDIVLAAQIKSGKEIQDEIESKLTENLLPSN